MKKLFFTVFSVGMIFWSLKLTSKSSPNNTSLFFKFLNPTEERLFEQVLQLKAFLNSNQGYNTELLFLIDMKISSGKNRFFVYDLKLDKIIDQGLVANGFGSLTGVSGELKFSNLNNSFCTSLGKYAIGASYKGQYGKAYKLYGLDPTNDNAFSRNIVLHKYEKVPYDEQEKSICSSLGCPMINEKYYERIEKRIDASKRKIILDIYY